MLYLGKDLVHSNIEQLQLVRLEKLFEMISSPDKALIQLATELQQIYQLDTSTFNRQKVKLPYFIGAEFRNNIRKTGNFIHVNYFIIDLDHCLESGDLEKEAELKKKLRSDQRIALLFTSPSCTGLKLVFKLKEPLTNSKRYTDFYLAFARKFASQYRLEDYIDFKTCDVTRVCFLNVDPMAYYNPVHITIDATNYFSAYDVFSEQVNEKEENDSIEGDTKKTLDEDIYQQILKTLNPKTPKRKKECVIPEILDEIVEPVKTGMIQYGIEVIEITNIQYGKKFRFRLEGGLAELNIYYGKNGFSVVKTPKSDVNETLNEIVCRIVKGVIYHFGHGLSVERLQEKFHEKNHSSFKNYIN